MERWDELVPALVAGRGDLIAADITVTEQRREKVAFTVPAHRTREHIVVRKGDRVESLRELEGREITIRERSSFWHAVQDARRTHPEIEVRLVSENVAPERLLASVADGRAGRGGGRCRKQHADRARVAHAAIPHPAR